ncbi:MAG: ribonuclease domain-containing protein [Bacillota bacterium]|nr:ribonuclease domain-containing protein [Bacillota bacterium]
MKRKPNLLVILLLVIAVLLSLFISKQKPGSGQQAPVFTPSPSIAASETGEPSSIDEKGIYTKKDDVALYVHTYGKLPGNFIAKDEARALGWEGGDLRPYAKDKAIGGDRFMNFEGLLPKKKGRVYYEADIDTLNKPSRGKKRLVFSNDGLIYYTDDHYESFTLLYGGD